MAADQTTAIFVAELIALLLCGRLLGEAMRRVGQPAIFGQLLAGVVLGPSVFGALAPEVRHALFPDNPALKNMIDAIAQIGILLLLLLTGMETNLALVRRRQRAVISSSLFGIVVPFACGLLMAYMLPASLMPTPAARLVTALFLGTALSVASVKIVAMVLMEVGAIRRDLGQLILATAILDDTIAWVLVAVISGIAAQGEVSLAGVGTSLLGVVIFLGLSLTLGRRLVAHIIRWSNDYLAIEVPVITAILVVMLTMSLITDLIGVHLELGAFVAGMLVGQSPILTEHIESQLRGFIVAFFSPIFFAVAGLGMDLTTLFHPTLLVVTLAMIGVASIGKFTGALLGGRIGGLTSLESIALATGLNARGSTEVIIASVGLSMGALNNELYTMIVAMAVVTTMIMPPSLRWVLERVPMREEEAKRLETEEAEQSESVPKMERALVCLDDSPNGALAATLAGLFIAGQQIVTTVMERAAETSGHDRLTEAATAAIARMARTALPAASSTAPTPLSLGELVQAKRIMADDAVEKEAAKGYSVAFFGIKRPISETANRFDNQLQRLVDSFDDPVAIVANGTRQPFRPDRPLDILVPTGGTSEARLATEFALALAKASGGMLTALHVFDPQEDTDLLRGRARRRGISFLVDARRLGKRSGVPVKGLTGINSRPEAEILRRAREGRYDLVVLGTSLRQGDEKFIGPHSAAVLRSIRTPVLLIAR
jgi:Kef-type K+ transport system membrane component KefB/nucleotide-binding universal stress UspA family protein